MRLPQPVLTGDVVRLEPLGREHVDGLRAAADADRSTFGWTRVPTPATVEEYVEEKLAQRDAGQIAPYAQVEVATGRVIGHTSYWAPRVRADGSLFAVEIGHTWLTPEAQAGAVNSESKLLLLTHCFETLGVARVDLKTDARNERSRAAIAAVGGVFEGVLRQSDVSRRPGEDLRDSAVFSLIAPEWPGAAERLRARVARKRG